VGNTSFLSIFHIYTYKTAISITNGSPKAQRSCRG
jgi:hypothetical protein